MLVIPGLVPGIHPSAAKVVERAALRGPPQPFASAEEWVGAGVDLGPAREPRCRMQGEAPTDWPSELQAVFAALGKAMGPARLNPEVLNRLPTERGAIVPGHEVRIIHLPKGVAARYVIELAGDRWSGSGWQFRSGTLENLARAALG